MIKSSNFMKKRLTSALCALFMILGLMQPFGVLASNASVQIDKVNVMMDQNKIYFDVEAELNGDARLIASIYDGKGRLIEMRSKSTRLGETISLDAHEDAVSYKIMLWSAENNMKPLCSSKSGAVSDISVYDADADYEKNARFLSELGIINATHKEFDKEINFTRAEFACVLCRLLDVADVANAFTKDNLYTDVESTHWAAGFINLLGESGMIDELEDGKFNPYDSISFDHAVAALMRALGYEPVAEESGGYGRLAADLMITRGVDKEEFKAKDVVNLVANSLEAYMLLPYAYNPKTTHDYFIADGKGGREQRTLLTDMGVYKVAGVIVNFGYGEMEFIAKEDCYEFGIETDDELYLKTQDDSLDDYVYELVDVYVKKDSYKNYEVKAVLPNKNCKTLTILSDDIISHSQSVIKYTLDQDNGQPKVADIDITYSRFNFGYGDLGEIIEDTDVVIKLIDNTGDGIYDAFSATKYTHSMVTSVDPNKEMIQLDRTKVYLDYEDAAAIILCDDKGNKLSLEDFNENDLVAVVYDSERPYRYNEYIKIVKLTETDLKGTVEAFAIGGTYNYVVIDGKQYTDVSGTDFMPGESYIFRLGPTGKIIYADIYEDGDIASEFGGISVSAGSTDGFSEPILGELKSVPVSFEATTSPAYGSEYVDNAKLLSAMGMISEVVSPTTEITRADFATIMCKVMNLEEAAAGYKDKNIFDDIDASHYAAGAVNLLAEKGIMKALSGKNFCPDTTVRYAHTMCSAVDALGYSPMAKSKGSSPLGYVKTAKQLGVLSDIECEYYLDAQMLVCLINNILDTCHMEEVSAGEYAVLDGRSGREYKTYLTEGDIYIATGILTGITEDTVTFDASEDSEDEEFEGDTQYVFDIDDYDAFDFLFMYCDVYVKKTGTDEYKLLYTAPNDMGSAVIINSNDIEQTDDGYIEYYIDPEYSTKTAMISHNIDTTSIVYNMKTGKINLDDIGEMRDARVVFIENTGDNCYDKAVVAKYMHGFVDYINAQTHTISVDGIEIELYPESQNIANILADGNGKKMRISDFKEGDFVAIMSDGDSFENYERFVMIQDLSENKITGVVESWWSNGENANVEINGTEYYANAEIFAGCKGDFYIGKTGTIEGFIPDMSDIDMGMAYILNATKFSTSGVDKWQIELLTQSGYSIIYDVSDTANSEFESYFADNTDAFGSANSSGEYLFENASMEQKVNPARLISLKENYNGEISQFEMLETNGGTQFENSPYDASTKTISETELDDNAWVFNLSDGYFFDISCLRNGGKYTGCVLKDTNNKNSIVIITGSSLENVVRGDLVNSETAFAVVKSVVQTYNSVIVNYTCNETDGTAIIGPSAIMHGDMNYYNISVGDVFAFIADDNGNVTDYAIIASMGHSYGGLILSEAGIEAVSDGDIEFTHGYIANKAKRVVSAGEMLNLDVGGEIETVLVRNSSTNKYTYVYDARRYEISTGDFMGDPYMYYYDEDDGYTSKVFVRICNGKMTDIYGYYHSPTN